MLEHVVRARAVVAARRAQLVAAMRGENGAELITVIVGIVIGIVVLAGVFIAFNTLGGTVTTETGQVNSRLASSTGF